MKLTKSLPSRAFLSVFSVLSVVTSIGALKFDITGKRQSLSAGLYKRDDTPNSFGNGSTFLTETSDIRYSCNITLGGQDFLVRIDTGRCAVFPMLRYICLVGANSDTHSTDLWVVPTADDIPGAYDTGMSAGVGYATGGVSGLSSEFRGTAEIASTTSCPSTTCPKIVCFPLR